MAEICMSVYDRLQSFMSISYQSAVLVIVGLVPSFLQQLVPSGEDWLVGSVTHRP